jgi:hypothetical protein
LKGTDAKRFEALVADRGLRNQKKISAPLEENLGHPEPSGYAGKIPGETTLIRML